MEKTEVQKSSARSSGQAGNQVFTTRASDTPIHSRQAPNQILAKRFPPSLLLTHFQLLQLQRSLGNRAVGRLRQAQLTTEHPDDPHEREADRVADTVMRVPPPTTPDREVVAVKLDSGPTPQVSSATAAEATKAIPSKTPTLEQNIAIGTGRFKPHSHEGRHSLPHEMTHLVQQVGVRPTPSKARGPGRDRILLRNPEPTQTLRLRRHYRYTGQTGTFQSHDFQPDLSTDITDWLAGRMRVFFDPRQQRPIDSLSRRLLSAFRRAHQVLGDRAALRRGQSYTYAARIDFSGASVQISEVSVNGLSPTAEIVMRRFESLPALQWQALSGCVTDFCLWVMGESETAAPALASTTTANCWEAILLAAFHAGVVSWQWLHDLYIRRDRRGDLAFAGMLSRGGRRLYAPPRHVPVRGDIVFFWTGNQLSHAGLATGRLNPRGESPEVVAFQGRPTGPATRVRVEPPSVRLSAGGRMRIEYATPSW